MALFRAAVASRPVFGDAHFMLGTVLRQSGDLPAALEHFVEAARLMPESAEVQLSLGQLLRQRGDEHAAGAAFDEARRLSARKTAVQASVFAVGVGRARLQAGERAAAIEKFREAIALAPDNHDAHYALSLSLSESGDRAGAARALAEARRLAPWLGDGEASLAAAPNAKGSGPR